MNAAWGPVLRATGLVAGVVGLVYLTTSDERMLGDFRVRAAAARAMARQCLATANAEPDYAELVRLETHIFQGDVVRCGLPGEVSRAGVNGAT
jgi:hypothetical protein